MKKFYLTLLLLFLLILVTSCSNESDSNITIKPTPESDYVKSFEDLNLGHLFDFKFRLPEADKRWVKVWVERYKDGEKVPGRVAEISYGKSIQNLDEGHLGFGVISPDGNENLYVLYAPGVQLNPHKSQLTVDFEGMQGWRYAIRKEEETEIKLGETKLLAVYRSSLENRMRNYDFQDDEQVEKMLKEDSENLLLKMKVEKVEE
ncbi:hypothetical protein [Pontibacillus marinus]|uniref:Lipoprotein n=1 Tax=Pontibacillus marinus BH030004 = DSM 16465 TaxID=1385511 RepID=A0A0A5G2Q7_9BACI|nr:hypothetical protein [Pontibacillus marinus]KGX85423.1 hypothetical protein N783_14620 [Pontibacillus marinus BH030004 = DSM 16465]